MKELNWNVVAPRTQPMWWRSLELGWRFQVILPSNSEAHFLYHCINQPLNLACLGEGLWPPYRWHFLQSNLVVSCQLSTHSAAHWSWMNASIIKDRSVQPTEDFTHLNPSYTLIDFFLVIKCSNSVITFCLISFTEKTFKKVNGMNSTTHIPIPRLPLDQRSQLICIYSLNYFSFKIFLNSGWYFCGGMINNVISNGISPQVPHTFQGRANTIVHLLSNFHRRIPRDASKG